MTPFYQALTAHCPLHLMPTTRCLDHLIPIQDLKILLSTAQPQVSVRPKGRAQFGTKVEVKNMNSFSNMQKAIEFEIERQVGFWGGLPCTTPLLAVGGLHDHALRGGWDQAGVGLSAWW